MTRTVQRVLVSHLLRGVAPFTTARSASAKTFRWKRYRCMGSSLGFLELGERPAANMPASVSG